MLGSKSDDRLCIKELAQRTENAKDIYVGQRMQKQNYKFLSITQVCKNRKLVELG